MDVQHTINEISPREFNQWFLDNETPGSWKAFRESIDTLIETKGIEPSIKLATYLRESAQHLTDQDQKRRTAYHNFANSALWYALWKLLQSYNIDNIAKIIPEFLFSDEAMSTTAGFVVYDFVRNGQTLFDLMKIFDEVCDNNEFGEFCVVFIQLLVIAGFDMNEFSIPIRNYWDELVENGSHVLSKLPLTLLDIERCLIKHFREPVLCYPHKEIFADFEHGVFGGKAIEITQESNRFTIEKVFEKWKEMWCPAIETRVFMFDQKIRLREISPSLLKQLNLECLKGAKKEDIQIVHLTPGEVFGVLFCLCRSGPLNNPGREYDPYARLKTWISVAGFLGESTDLDLMVIKEKANNGFWAYVNAKSDWFFDQGDDHFILCLRPDLVSLSIIAVSTVQS